MNIRINSRLLVLMLCLKLMFLPLDCGGQRFQRTDTDHRITASKILLEFLTGPPGPQNRSHEGRMLLPASNLIFFMFYFFSCITTVSVVVSPGRLQPIRELPVSPSIPGNLLSDSIHGNSPALCGSLAPPLCSVVAVKCVVE